MIATAPILIIDFTGLADGDVLVYDGTNKKWIVEAPDIIDGAPAKADKVVGATAGHFAGLDSSGNLTDSGLSSSSFDASGAAATVQTNLTSHISNTSNPHSVTAAQVGAYPSAVCVARKTGGTTTAYNAGADTDAARGTALLAALAAAAADATITAIDLGPGTFNIGNVSASIPCSIYGAGSETTLIASAAAVAVKTTNVSAAIDVADLGIEGIIGLQMQALSSVNAFNLYIEATQQALVKVDTARDLYAWNLRISTTSDANPAAAAECFVGLGNAANSYFYGCNLSAFSNDGSTGGATCIRTSNTSYVYLLGSILSSDTDGGSGPILDINSGGQVYVDAAAVYIAGKSTGTINPFFSYGVAPATVTSQTANSFLAGPTSGAAATPTFRSLVALDIPVLPYLSNQTTINTLLPSETGNSGKFLTTNGTVASWASVTVPTAANPSAFLGLASVNGTAATFMRSDAAPALDPALAATGLIEAALTFGAP